MSAVYRFCSRSTSSELIRPGRPSQRVALLGRHLPLSPVRSMASSQIPKTMSGVLVEETGGVEVLQYKTDLPVPTLKDGEVLVKNDVIGINFIDTYFRTGLYKSPKPEILGREAAGHVVSTSAGVTAFKPGDRVGWMHNGGYAEYTAVPWDNVLKIPEAVSLADACAAMIQGLTAITLVEEAHKVERDDWVMVLAASGGTGGWLCQVLKAKGAHTIATVGSEGKVAVAKESGAEVVLVEGTMDVKEEVMKLTGGKGVVAVFDGVGKNTFDRSLSCVARKGTMVSFGNASGALEPFLISRLAGNNAKVCRPTLFNYIATREELEQYANEVFDMISTGKITIRIHDTYPLKDVARAQSDLEGRKTMGKLLMKP